MECFVAANKLRCLVTALGFGCVFLWVASGLYLDTHSTSDDHWTAAEAAASLRRSNREWLGDPPPPRASSARRLLFRSRKQEEAIPAATGDEGGIEEAQFESGEGSGDGTYDPKTALCSGVSKMNSTSRRCRYIKTVDSCQNDGGLLNYLQFIYCVIPYRLIPLAMTVLFFWLIFLFIFLGATAEEYFCPALTVISKVLRLGQNVAGVTLLALGNGAPDIFSAFAAINQSDDHKSSLAIGALFGAGIFVTTVVVGGVAFLEKFTLTKRPFLRDIIFYTIAVYWTFYLLWINTVTIYMAAGFIALYVFYVVVVIVGRLVYQRWSQTRNKDELGSPAPDPLANGILQSTLLLPPSPLTVGDAVKPAVAEINRETSGEETEGESDAELKHNPLRTTLHQAANNPTSEYSTESDAHVYQGGSLQATTDEGTSDKDTLHPPSSRQHRSQLHRPRGKRGAQREISKSTGPLFPQFEALLAVPGALGRRAVTPTAHLERGWKYAQQRQRSRSAWDGDERPRSATPRTLFKKSLSGALGVSEEVVTAVGLPHTAVEEIQRVNQQRDSPLFASHRSHRSGSEGGSRHSSFHNTEDEEEEEEELLDEKMPLLEDKPRKINPLRRFLQALFPFGEDFKQLGLPGKIYEILKYPCGLMLTLTVPVIDLDAELCNWNKWLNVLHCITGPMIVVLLTEVGFETIGGVFPVWALVLIFGVLLAAVVACTSWSDRVPVYHCAFAWMGFAIGVVWIYVIANEIVNLLQAFGIVVKLSDGILGITLLAWGNSIGDAVANMTMARQGFPRMAIGACYGGPLLNMLIGVGVSSLYKSIKRSDHDFQFKLYFTQVEFFAAVFLMTTLAVSMAVITLSRYRIHRTVGVCLIAFYIVFLAVAVLAEIPVFKISISGVISEG